MFNRLLFILLLGGLLIPLTIFAQEAGGSTMGPSGTGNNQVIAKDAIGLRVVPNPEHLSPLNWYTKNIRVKGSPQSIMVDGYEAVRDGRTVYVNAAKIVSGVSRCDNGQVCTNNSQCPINSGGGGSSLPLKFVITAYAAGCNPSNNSSELFTNIYIISYNQNPENTTTDIFGQILQYWKFNTDIKNCSKTVTQACNPSNNTCPGNDGVQESCGSTGWCSLTKTKTCIIDTDCPQDEYCNSKKSAIIRDVKRLAVLGEVKIKLENYNKVARTFPKLETGTYVTGRSISTWPSWSQTFSATIGSAMPVDQINKLGPCKSNPNESARFDPITCWDDKVKEFSGQIKPLSPPVGSHVYYYHYNPVKPNDNSYRFCTIIESGYIMAKEPHSEFCITGTACNVDCTNRQCGDNGCGGSCGTCPSGQTCQSGRCRNTGSQYE